MVKRLFDTKVIYDVHEDYPSMIHTFSRWNKYIKYFKEKYGPIAIFGAGHLTVGFISIMEGGQLLTNDQLIVYEENENGIIGGLEFAKQTFKLIDKKIKL